MNILAYVMTCRLVLQKLETYNLTIEIGLDWLDEVVKKYCDCSPHKIEECLREIYSTIARQKGHIKEGKNFSQDKNKAIKRSKNWYSRIFPEKDIEKRT